MGKDFTFFSDGSTRSLCHCYKKACIGGCLQNCTKVGQIQMPAAAGLPHQYKTLCPDLQHLYIQTQINIERNENRACLSLSSRLFFTIFYVFQRFIVQMCKKDKYICMCIEILFKGTCLVSHSFFYTKSAQLGAP